MPLSVTEVIKVLSQFSQEKELKLTVTQSAKGAAIAGGSAFVGGLLGGPVGIAVGGGIGSLVGASFCKDFKPLATVLRELPRSKKQELTQQFNNLVSGISFSDLAGLLLILQSDPNLQGQVVSFLSTYFTKTQGCSVSY